MIPALPKGFTHPMPIGKGAFSSVYRVRQGALDRWVAIKVLAEKSPDRRQGMLKEARKHAQLGAAGIPALYDAFEWRGQVCIVMQWIKGVSLEALLEKGLEARHRGPLAAALLAVLAGLHRLGYAHRDLKPANILVSPEDGVYLVDFGFARRIDNPEQSLAGVLIGTPAYMAPELWKTGDADLRRADLWSLGRILKRLDPGGEWPGLIEELLREDPAGRPASAAEAWKSRESWLAAVPPCDWKSAAGRLTADTLSHQVIQSARELLFAGREDEAYWLGIEALELDPDSAEAMKLLDQVPAASRRKARVRRLARATLAAGFALAVASAFLLGRRSGGAERFAAVSAEPGARALLLPGLRPAAAGAAALPLRELAGRGGLAGRLTVRDASRCDSLRLDGRELPSGSASEGVVLLAGEHQLLCRCGETPGGGIRRERVALLPFQDKTIELCAPPPGGGT